MYNCEMRFPHFTIFLDQIVKNYSMINKNNSSKKSNLGLLSFFLTIAFKRILVLFFVLTLVVPSIHGQTFKLNPYLQNPAPDGVTIMWQTTDPSYSWIEYGEDMISLKKARSVEHGIVKANITSHKVRISGLSPDTKYYYRICTQKVLEYKAYSKLLGNEVKTDFYTFSTLGSEDKDFKCLIFNDIHNDLTLFDNLMKQVNFYQIKFDFSIFNGDIFADPSSEDQILNLVKNFNKGIDASNKYVFYLRGNHEIRGPAALIWPSFFDFQNSQTYSAFSYGDTRFVLLDNGEDKSDGSEEYSGLVDFDGFRLKQTEWLTNEIATSDFKNAFRKILVHHIPIYSWENSYDPGFMPCFALWDPIFKTTPFDVDITGHLHGFKFHSKNSVNNPFPLVVGGGNTETSARVLILEKQGEVLTLKSMDCSGNMQVFPIYTQNATLKIVSVEGGTLHPAFDPDQTEYQILVSSQISTLSIDGQALKEYATVKGNVTKKICTIGEKIVITVTTEDGTLKKYTFEVGLSEPNAINNFNSANINIYPTVLDQGSPLHIDFIQPVNDVSIRIFNIEGKEVYVDHAPGSQTTIPLSLKQGTYILNISAGEKKYVNKFIIRQ